MSSPLIYFGGKGHIARWIRSLMPSGGYDHYVEPFAGGASVLFSLPAGHSQLETLNDIDGDVANFYRVLADRWAFALFQRSVSAIPHCREIWEEARERLQVSDDPIERAVTFFVTLRQSVAGQTVRTGWGRNLRAVQGSSCARKWMAAVDRLEECHQRLAGVQIDHVDWRRCLADYDDPDTLFYIDPPYHPETRGETRYRWELDVTDHQELVQRCMALSGKVLLSGYAHTDYSPLEAAGWQRSEREVTTQAATNGARPRRVECVWRNPAAVRSSLLPLERAA